MFSDRRRLRRWAAQMLFAWLFGLAIGVANACTLAQPSHSTAEVAAAAAHDAKDADGEGDHGKANCIDFCVKTSIGSPKLKLADDTSAGQAFPVLAPGYATAALAWLPERDAPQRARSDLRGSPPLRTVLQRLTL